MNSAVKWLIDGELGVVTLDRVESRNSLRVDEMEEVGLAFERAAAAGARCILVRGEGGAFCAGRDLKDTRPGEDDTYEIVSKRINPALDKVRRCGVPTISAVQGPALGFGFGLALACDITIVADNALMGSPFRNIGLMLDSGGHHCLRERLGRHKCAEIVFLGKLFSGREAAEMGLVNRSVGALDVEGVASGMARSISQGPTAAFRATKEILSANRSYEESAELEAIHQARLIAGPDGIEGIDAFQKKRRPRFVGR